METNDGCDQFLQRPLTDTASPQIINSFTSLISFTRQASLNRGLNKVPKEKLEALLKNIESVRDFEDAFVFLQTSKEAEFQAAFADSSNNLINAVPWVKTVNVPATIDEQTSHIFNAQAYHWRPDYPMVIAWKLNGVTVSNAVNFSYTPSGNSAGVKTLELFVGMDDGNGQINTSQPYTYKSYSFQVNNSVLPTPPQLESNILITSNTTFPVSILTGTLMSECDSFSGLALTIQNAVPTVFNINCTTALSQVENVLLSGADGLKTIKLWARDANGVVSALPSTYNVTLDRGLPTLALIAPTTAQAGGNPFTLAFSATDPNGISSITLHFSSNDGSTWTDIGTYPSGTTSLDWEIPLVNSTQNKVKIRAVDTAGNSQELVSAAFTIISVAPDAPAVTLASATPTNSQNISVNISNCPSFDKILIKETSSRPASGAAGWVNCTTPVSYTLSDATNGTRTVYLFSKDVAGNVSAASSVSLTFDNIAPSPAYFRRDSAGHTNQTLMKASYTDCTGVSHILIKSDSTTPLVGDAGWTACSSTPDTISASITASEGNHSLYAFAKDSVGNISSAATLTTRYDSTPPTLTSAIINPSSADPNVGDEYYELC